jgi:crotonobetainyl-CoA:carnitine CoA-transferase CaiB-like acyl-CoA transferase
LALPLDSICVLDLSRDLAGPFCSMILADLGAEVIKVEAPGKGDEARSWGPPFIGGDSAYFLGVNRNKKSVAINLKAEEGKEILYKMVEKSDVFLGNFRPIVAERLGIHYEKISKINPRIIYCSISGFGYTGPYRNRPAYDIIIQGMSGIMGITGEEGRPPVRVGVAIADLSAGMYAAIAILSAIIARGKSGKGQWIDISLLDSAVTLLVHDAANYFVTGVPPKRMGSAHPNIAPYQCFRAADGKYLVLAVANDEIWKRFCRAIGLERLIHDPEFATNGKRVQNREKLVSLLSEVFLTKERDEWIRIFAEAEVPCGPVNTIDEVFQDPQILERNMLIEIKHPKTDKLRQIGIPIKFSDTQLQVKSPPPLLGQHTEDVLKNLLNMNTHEINRLKEMGVI